METTTLTNIQFSGFKAYADVVIFDPHETGIVFLSVFGNKSNLKAISAALLSRANVQIRRPETYRHDFMTLKADYTFNSMIKHADPVTALDHVIFYPTAASYAALDNSMKDIIFLFRADSDPAEIQRSLYLYLDKALAIPIHENWTAPLTQALQDERLITELPGEGPLTAWKIELWQDKIISIISGMIQDKTLSGVLENAA